MDNESSIDYSINSDSDKIDVVLCIDDVPTNLRILISILQSTSAYHPIAINSGQKALDSLETGLVHPNIILLDVNMPGMSGLELLSILKASDKWKSIPVVLLTGNEGARDEEGVDIEEKCLSLGAEDFLRKPIRTGVLLNRIRLQLEMRKHRERLEELVKQRTDALLHADRMATLGTLSAGIAHEINNPTTFISGNLATFTRFWNVIAAQLKKGQDSQTDFVIDEMPKLISGMKSGVERISKIVGGLKTFSRATPIEKEHLNINSIIDDALFICTNTVKRCQLNKEYREDLPEIHGDSTQIEQIITNLVTNACDAMANTPNPTLTISTSYVGSQVHVKIEDNGPGIPNDLLRRIWDPFFTTKAPGKGTGLGLSISSSIAQAHGGKLTVHNNPNGGAIFLLSLPANGGQT